MRKKVDFKIIVRCIASITISLIIAANINENRTPAVLPETAGLLDIYSSANHLTAVEEITALAEPAPGIALENVDRTQTLITVTDANDIVTVIGTGGRGHEDGGKYAARFALPHGITRDANGNVLVFDTYNNAIRIVASDTAITLAGGAERASFNDGPIHVALLGRPAGGVVNSRGDIFFADSANHIIRKIKDGTVYTFSGTTRGFADGARAAAQFNNPMAMAIDKNDNIYVADTLNDSIRKIDPAGNVITIARGLNSPAGIAVSDDGSIIYVADTGNHLIRKIENGTVTTIAGAMGRMDADNDPPGGFADGNALEARFNLPRGLALAGDSILVADSGNHTIREITMAGQVITIAGSGYPGDDDGPRTGDALNTPTGLHYRNGRLYISDMGNNKIKQMQFGPRQASPAITTAARTSRSVSIFRTQGANVTMTRGTDRQFNARADMQLFDGYTVITGADSYCYLRLDDGSLLKMDQNSKISIGRTWRNRLSISVLSGGLLVDAASQQPGSNVEVRVGNSAIAIRGTMFIAEHMPDGEVTFTMFEGSGEAGGVRLNNGYTVNVLDTTTVTRKHELRRITFNRDTSLFVLQSVLADVDRFVQNGIISREDVPALESLEREKQGSVTTPEPTLAEQGRILFDEWLASMNFIFGGGAGGGNSGSDVNNGNGNVSIVRPEVLRSALVLAYSHRVDVRVSENNGADVFVNRQWVTPDVMNTFNSAIRQTENFLASPLVLSAQANAERDAIVQATIQFHEAYRHSFGSMPLPVLPEHLGSEIANGYAARAFVLPSENGYEIDHNRWWVTGDVMDGLDAALRQAEREYDALMSAGQGIMRAAPLVDVASAVLTLNDAITVFNNSRQPGLREPMLHRLMDVNTALLLSYMAKSNVVVNSDAANVPQGVRWVTRAEMDALDTAIARSEEERIRINAQIQPGEELGEALILEIASAALELNDARAVFTASIKDGARYVPRPADVTALQSAIVRAAGEKLLVVVSADGSGVLQNRPWVTPEEMRAFDDAIEAAQAAVRTAQFQTEAGAAYAALQEAVTAFRNAIKPGTGELDHSPLLHVISSADMILSRVGAGRMISVCHNGATVYRNHLWAAREDIDAFEAALDDALAALAATAAQNGIAAAADELREATGRFISSLAGGTNPGSGSYPTGMWHNINNGRVHAGSDFNAAVDAAMPGDTIILSGDSTVGAMRTITNTVNIVIAKNATLTNTQSAWLGGQGTFTNNGTIVVTAPGGNYLLMNGTFTNNGTIDIRLGGILEIFPTGTFANNGLLSLQAMTVFIYNSANDTIQNNGAIWIGTRTAFTVRPSVRFTGSAGAFFEVTGNLANVQWDISNFFDADGAPFTGNILPAGIYFWNPQLNGWVSSLVVPAYIDVLPEETPDTPPEEEADVLSEEKETDVPADEEEIDVPPE